MKTLLGSVVLSIAAFTILTGCGSSSSDSSSTTSTALATARYVDSAVAGVAYNCGSQQGFTDETGAFHFERGKQCILSVGDVVLRNVDTSNLPDQAVILEDNTATAQFLQSLDKDGNPNNGINIDQEIHSVLKTEGVHSIPKDDTELAEVVTKVKNRAPDFQGRFVSKAEAEEHLRQTEEMIMQENNSNMDDTNNHQENKSSSDKRPDEMSNSNNYNQQMDDTNRHPDNMNESENKTEDMNSNDEREH